MTEYDKVSFLKKREQSEKALFSLFDIIILKRF